MECWEGSDGTQKICSIQGESVENKKQVPFCISYDQLNYYFETFYSMKVLNMSRLFLSFVTMAQWDNEPLGKCNTEKIYSNFCKIIFHLNISMFQYLIWHNILTCMFYLQ